MTARHSMKYPACVAIFRAGTLSGGAQTSLSEGPAQTRRGHTARALRIFLVLWIGLAGYAPRAAAQNTPLPAMDLSEPDGSDAKNDGDAASATIEVFHDWPLTPSGFGVGDQFRLLFMTASSVIATIPVISTYDNSITLSASATRAHPNIRAYGQSFKAFVNTADGTSGRTHTGMWSNNAWTDGSTSASSSGIPIYWLNGNKVADNYFDFCDKSWDNRWSSGQNHIRNERGATESGSRVWTGMNGNCTAGANPLGSNDIFNIPPAAYGPGAESAGNEGPLFKGTAAPGTNSYNLYGMSPVFEVAAKADIAVSVTGTKTFPEGATVTFVIVFDPALPSGKTVTLPLTYGGTASLNTDYTMRCASPAGVSCRNLNSRTAEVTFNGAQLNSHRVTALEMDILKDNLTEGQETVTLTFNNNTLALDIDDPPSSVTMEFVRSAFSVPESTPKAQPTIDVSPAAGEDIVLSLLFTDGTATSGTDYTPQASHTIPAGKVRFSVDIPIIDDATYEGDETFTMAIDTANLPGFVKAGSIASATITIQDDETPTPGVTVSKSALNLTEGGAAGSYEISLNTQPSGNVTVTATSGDGGKVKVHGPGGTAANSATLTFTTSNYNSPQTVTVTPQQDTDANDESVTISHAVSNTGGYGGVTAPSVDVNVNDDDKAKGVTVSKNTLNLTEGGAAGSYEISLNTQPSGNVTVTATSGDGSKVKVHGPGRTAANSATLLFRTSNYSSPQTVTVTPQQDSDANDESVTISHAVSNSGGYSGVTASSVTVNVNDDETTTTPTLSVALSPASAQEGNAGASYATVTVSMNPARSQATNFNTCLGSASTATRGASADYQFVRFDNDTPLSLTNGCYAHAIDANATQSRVRLRIRGDTEVEPDETIVVELRDAPQGVDIAAAAGSATYTILNDDSGSGGGGGGGGGGNPTDPALPVVTIAGGADVTEGDNANFTLTAAPAPSANITVSVRVEDRVSNFISSSARGVHTVDMPTSGTATLAVRTVNDQSDEPDGAVVATIEGGSGYTPGDPATARITVNDDDTPTSAERLDNEIPEAFALEQNYPNPFNPATTIEFALDKAQHVTLSVHDMLGQQMRLLLEGPRPAGRYRVRFDAESLASGPYVYILRTEEDVAVKTMALVK